MKKINISVTKAQIVSFSVELQDKQAQVSATIGLFTDAGKGIATYYISSNSYDESKKFDLPAHMVAPIMEILHDLETIAVRHMNEGQLTITK